MIERASIRLAVVILAASLLPGCGGAPGARLEENKTVVRRYLEEVVNTGNVDRLADYIAPGYVEVHDNTEHALGLPGAREHILGVRRAFPDLRVTIEQQLAEGDWVATRITARGTHRGEWLGWILSVTFIPRFWSF